MKQIQVDTCPSCGGDLRLSPGDVAFCYRCRFPIKLIANKYQMQRALSEGGFGSVYLAHHIKLKRDKERAIKIIKPELFASHPELADRFEREVQMTATLSQQNQHIVRIYDDFGEEEDVGYYYIMEYLEGRPLVTLGAERTALTDERTFHIVWQLCQALAAAHQEGIIHRDLKPDNILLTTRNNQRDFVKLIDFGIAKPLNADETQLTQGALGTPSYMAPEQCVAKGITPATDIYSLGMIVYEMITGLHPYGFSREDGSPPVPVLQVLNAHLTVEPTPLRQHRDDLSPAFEKVIGRCLSKKPHKRFQTVEDLWEAIRATAPASLHLLPLAGHQAHRGTQQYTPLPLPEGELPISPSALPSGEMPGLPATIDADDFEESFADTAFMSKSTTERLKPATKEWEERDNTPPSIEVNQAEAPASTTTIVVREDLKESEDSIALDDMNVPSRGGLWVGLGVGGIGVLLVLWMTGALTKSNVSSPMPRQTPSIGQKRVRPVLPVRRVVPRRVVVPERRIVPERRVIARPVPPMVRVRRVVLRKALARHQRVCGVPAKRYRWVLGRLSKGSIRKATIKFLGCVGCRYQRRGRYLCLQLPTRKRTSIRVVLDGYQTCRHGIGARHHRVLWRLKVLEPDALPDELYGCATF